MSDEVGYSDTESTAIEYGSSEKELTCEEQSSMKFEFTPQQEIFQTSGVDPVEEAFAQYMETGKLPNKELYGKLLLRMKAEALQAIMTQNYPKANHINSGIDKIMAETQQSRLTNYRNKHAKLIDHKLRKAKRHLQREEEQWQIANESYESESEQALIKIKERHNQEIEDLKELWRKPETLKPYNKASKELLRLRKQEKTLALGKNFAEAEQVRLLADKRQLQEIREAEEIAKEAFKRAYDTVMEQHRKEIVCFKEHKHRVLVFLEKEKQRFTVPLENQIKSLEKVVSARKLPNGKPAPETTYVKRRTYLRSSVSIPASTETNTTMSHFRSASRTCSLGLSGLDPEAVIGKRK